MTLHYYNLIFGKFDKNPESAFLIVFPRAGKHLNQRLCILDELRYRQNGNSSRE